MAVWLERLGALLLVAPVLLTPVAGSAQPAPLGSLWHGKGGEVRVVACPPGGDTDSYCRALAATTATRTIGLGGGYMSVKLLWQRNGKQSGPDVLVLGDSGGSGGDADLFAVTLTPEVRVTKWSGERFDLVAVRPGGPALRLTLPFDIEYFNDAPHAGVIILPLPVIWSGTGLVLDRRARLRQALSAGGDLRTPPSSARSCSPGWRSACRTGAIVRRTMPPIRRPR